MSLQGVIVSESDIPILDHVVGPVLLNSFFCLFKNNVAATVDSLLADFVEADFHGYQEWQATAFTGIFKNPVGAGTEVFGEALPYTSDLDQPPQNVYGWFVKDALSGYLIAAGNFGTPITFQFNGDGICLIFTVNVSEGQIVIFANLCN
jgi:hypothetical protein